MNQKKKESNLNKNAITGIVALTKIITYISWIGLFIFLLLCLDDKLNMNLIPEKIDPIPLAFLIGISLSFGILIILPFTLDTTKQQIKTLEKNKQSLTDYIYANITQVIGCLILCVIISQIPAIISLFIEIIKASFDDLTKQSF